jgi:prefoldin subunit 5
MLQLELLRANIREIDELKHELEGVQKSIIINEKGVKELEKQATVAQNSTMQLRQDVTRLETSAQQLQIATSQV